jgi:hypothetical protein
LRRIRGVFNKQHTRVYCTHIYYFNKEVLQTLISLQSRCGETEGFSVINYYFKRHISNTLRTLYSSVGTATRLWAGRSGF